MLEQVGSSKSRAANPVALGVIGLAFVLAGAALLGLAFSGATFGRVVTHAWVAGVAGLVFLIPGAVAAGYGLVRVLDARRKRGRRGRNGVT